MRRYQRMANYVQIVGMHSIGLVIPGVQNVVIRFRQIWILIMMRCVQIVHLVDVRWI